MRLLDALRLLAPMTSWQWGLVTTAQAAGVGVSRLELSRLAAKGLVERVAQGVYRLVGAPSDRFDALRIAWVSTNPVLEAGVRMVAAVPDAVVSGPAAAYVHGIGDLVPEPYEFTVPRRRQTARDGLVYRIRVLEAGDVTRAAELPVTTVERTIADLVDEDWGLNLVGGVAADALGVDEERVVHLLAPLAARSGLRPGDGAAVWRELLGKAGRSGEALGSVVGPTVRA
ncbi:MAG: type IV toxin-antitoxin system AbiEi family antitoxin domain-containing protein [Bifidobacteriaceae bacterium]|jgi:predicted transcriptional regulator of viral defense system|nr:type IV toxin-antitoxin system AbiEi family antitoxin domain-containing protein [Bifidobacteriaceae bacterium]